MSTIATSVIICTHNPRADYFARVLDALRQQTLRQERWELLVIDNASSSRLSDRYLLGWHRNSRHIREDELGLTRARMRGIGESAGELLIFVDDDNVIAVDYLETALELMDKHDELGVIGGAIVPEFEVEPPEHLRPYLGSLALRDVSKPRWSNVPTCQQAEPCGAGLCVRRAVALDYAKHCSMSQTHLPDRTGRTLISGGDTEICMVACALGLGMGVFPELKVTHLIPQDRLKEQYLLNIAEGINTSVYLVDWKWHRKCPESPFTGLGMLRFIKNWVSRRGIQRRMYLADVRATIAARKLIKRRSSADGKAYSQQGS